MKQAQHQLTVRAQSQGLVEITREVAAWVAEQSIDDGLLTVFIRHTSASILIQENADPNVQRDLETFLAMLGTWQGIYLFEHRRAPRDREIVLHLIGD